MGAEPTFNYTASEDAEVHFRDVSTQSLSAALIVFADQQPAEYVNGLPMVASVERCGWERPAWTLRGVATVELGAAAFNVRVLGAEEAEEVLGPAAAEMRSLMEARLASPQARSTARSTSQPR